MVLSRSREIDRRSLTANHNPTSFRLSKLVTALIKQARTIKSPSSSVSLVCRRGYIFFPSPESSPDLLFTALRSVMTLIARQGLPSFKRSSLLNILEQPRVLTSVEVYISFPASFSHLSPCLESSLTSTVLQGCHPFSVQHQRTDSRFTQGASSSSFASHYPSLRR